MVKKKHTKSFEAIERRVSNLRFEIEERRQEFAELAELLQQYEFSASLDIRSIKDMGISPKSLV
jgi:hypothetical protein